MIRIEAEERKLGHALLPSIHQSIGFSVLFFSLSTRIALESVREMGSVWVNDNSTAHGSNY
jgi:hypothetical protein